MAFYFILIDWQILLLFKSLVISENILGLKFELVSATLNIYELILD